MTSYIISSNEGGLSNRLKCIASCIRMADFNLDNVKTKWRVISNYKKDKHILNCNYTNIIKNPKEYNNQQIKIEYTPERLFIKKEDNIPKNFSKFESNCKKIFKKTPMGIDFEFKRIPDNIKMEYIKAFSKIELCDHLQEKIEKFSKKFTNKTVSVHIRSWNRPNEETRRSLHFKTKFICEMDKFSNDYNFFLTSDSQKVINYFTQKSKLKDRIIIYPRIYNLNKSRDTSDGITEDLIELYLLSKNNYLIGSHFSTYTEVAWWLGKCSSNLTVI